MKYTFYRLGIDESDLDKADIAEAYSMNALKRLPKRLKEQMIELLRIMEDDLESGILS